MSSEPELRQLRTFVALAEELHFGRAAERLNLAQQSLSAQIRKLEARLGVELFERTTRRVELTEAGRTLLSHAMPLLASATRAWEEVARVGSGETGVLSVSYAPTAREEVLPRILEEVHRRHPYLKIKSCETWWGRDAVTSDLADVAIVRGAVPEELDMEGVTLMESRLGLVLGAEHPLAGLDVIEVEEMEPTALVIPARRFSPGFHDTILEALRTRGFSGGVIEYENLGSRFLLDDESAVASICSGIAFGIGFEGQYKALPPELVWIPVQPALYVPLNMCWHHANAMIRNFVTTAMEVARSEGWHRAEPAAEPDIADWPPADRIPAGLTGIRQSGAGGHRRRILSETG